MFSLTLLKTLESAQVKYVLVGGLALNLHGVIRATMDIDLVVALDEDNFSRAVAALRSLGLEPAIPVSWDEVLQPGQLERWGDEKNLIALSLRKPQGYDPTLDLLIKSPLPFDQLYANRVVKNIGGTAVSVASIDDLIAMKRAAQRKIDLSDIEALESLKHMQGSSS